MGEGLFLFSEGGDYSPPTIDTTPERNSMSDNNEVTVFEDPYASKLSPIRSAKSQLLREYRAQRASIIDKADRTNAGYNSDQLMNLILEEMLYSTEELQGDKLFLESEGNIQASATITIRRNELLKMIGELVNKTKELKQRTGEVDLNSPAFMIFQKMCFEKMVEVMDDLKLDRETASLLVSGWQEKMLDWDKELKKTLKEMEE